MSIEDGTFELRRPAPTDGGGSDNPAQDGTNPMNEALIRTTEAFNSELRKLANDSNAEEIKTVLRSYIETLEDLYKQI